MDAKAELLAKIDALEAQAAEIAAEYAKQRTRDPMQQRQLAESRWRELTAPLLQMRVDLARTDMPTLLIGSDGLLSAVPGSG